MKLSLIEELEILANAKYFQIYYWANYKYSPEERLTEIKSQNEIVSILGYMKKFVPDLLDYFKVRELKSVLNGYIYQEKLISPTLMYLHGMKMDQYLSQVNLYSFADCNSLIEVYKNRFDLVERMLFGFPITQEEYDSTLETLKRSRFF